MKLTAAVLACLAAAVPAQEAIDLHEWGVVLYSGDSIRALCSAGAPWLAPVSVDAPVLYFHGARFTGGVTVGSLGRISDCYPEPDERGGPLWNGGGLGSMIRWEGIEILSPAGDVLPVDDRTGLADISIPGFDWALDLWRIEGSNLVTRPSDGFSDCFLYYEVDFTDTGFPIPLHGFEEPGTPSGETASECLEFRRLDNGVIACVAKTCGADQSSSDESLPLPEADKSCEAAFETVRGWASGILTDEEVRAMWATWEPWIYHGDWRGRCLLVFPVPQPVVEKIGFIRVENDQGLPVEQHRFFLGMLPE